MKKKVSLILQCRLSSTRLKGKALLPLGNGTVLSHVLLSMKKVPCDDYVLATDKESAPFLKDTAEKFGYELYTGSLSDVLSRYTGAIKKYKSDVVVRGTCDNPFLFYEAASSLLQEFLSLNDGTSYMTYTGLPHGSGVEVFDAHSLLEAESLTSDPYDHEHVGPALYRHTDRFKCVFKKADEKFYFPNLRTTVDTKEDYFHAVLAYSYLNGFLKK